MAWKVLGRNRPGISAFFILTVILAAFWPLRASASEDVVRVGFFPMSGYQEYDEQGNPKGYNVEYLEQVSVYTGWTYEYVPVDSWDDALKALRNGDIDLLGSAQMTAERAKYFDYGDYSGGSTYGAVLALNENDQIAYEDFEQFDQSRIGCVKTYVREQDFLDYAKKNGIRPQLIYFDDTAQMKKALHNGGIDLAICNVMEIDEGEKVVGRYAHAPFYYITTKGNAELLKKLNEAMAGIKLSQPGYENQLFSKYYPGSAWISYTRDELEFIRSAPVICVAMYDGRSPISSMEGSGFVGISADLVRWLEEDTGLDFEFVRIPEGIAPELFLESGKADLVAGIRYTDDVVKNSSLVVTDPYFDGELVLIGRKGEDFSDSEHKRAAVPMSFTAEEQFIHKAYPELDIEFYENTEDCLDAVNDGQADIMIQNSYVVSESLQRQRYKNLVMIPNTGMAARLCIGSLVSADSRYISILNKSISHLPQDMKDQAVIHHTIARTYAPTLEDFVLQYAAPLIIIGVITALLVLAVLLIFRQRQKFFNTVRASEQRLQNITNNINGGVVTITPDRMMLIRYANDGFMNLIGMEDKELIKDKSFITFVDHNNQVDLLFTEKIKKSTKISMELGIQHKDGHFIPVLLRGTLSGSEDGNSLMYCVIVDISDQKKMIQELEAEKERSRLLIEMSDSIFFDVHITDGEVRTSPAFYRKFGWDIQGGNQWQDSMKANVHKEDAYMDQILSDIHGKKRNSVIDARMRKKDGDYIWCRFTLGYFYEGDEIIRLFGKIEDIDEDTRRRKHLEVLSMRDKLTQLSNRNAFQAAFQQFLEETKEDTDARGALYFVDLDNFKAVNDNLGHSAGDQALVDAAKSLRQVFRSKDIIGRFGGDEFFIFVRGLPRDRTATKARELCNAVRKSYAFEDGNCVTITASVGISYYPENGTTLEKLVECADSAAYRSKHSGKDQYTVYSEMIENIE